MTLITALRASRVALAAALAAPALAQPVPAAPAASNAAATAAPTVAPPGVAPPVVASPGSGSAMRDPFGEATILRTQAQAQAAARFTALDTDKDGALSPAELAAARPARAGGAGGMARPDGHRGDDRRDGPRRWGMGRMDADGDGKVTQAEFVAGTLRRFDRMDTNHDGQLTKAERQAALEAMRARMAERVRERATGEAAGQMDGPMGGTTGGPAGSPAGGDD